MATLDDAGIAAATVGALQPYAVTVVLEEYNPAWPVWYAEEEAAIRAALGDVAVRIEHTGSTSVPGLAAKALIDILLLVPDAADEAAYLPALEAAGYALRIRQPDSLSRAPCGKRCAMEREPARALAGIGRARDRADPCFPRPAAHTR
ncbi:MULTISPECIES: GrpB family protein [unclassified Nocardia]|uniref:GrpB family protein n=1 Tax=Nocardia sp. NPDC019302 TaxID=3154592 RepID=UPI0033D8A9AC